MANTIVQKDVDRTYPFTNNTNIVPVLKIRFAKIRNAKWFEVPNENIISFNFKFGGTDTNSVVEGNLVLFESFGQGRGKSKIGGFIATLMNITHGIDVQFGWSNGILSPIYNMTPIAMNYETGDEGNTISIKMITNSQRYFYIQSKFDENAEKKWLGFKEYSVLDILKIVIDFFNTNVNDSSQKLHFQGINTNEKTCFDCDEILTGKTETFKSFPLANKTIKEVLDHLIKDRIIPTNISKDKQKDIRYEYTIQTTAGKNYLYIWKVDLTKKYENKDLRLYVYRRGSGSNILHYSFHQDNSFFQFSQALNCNIKAVGFDPSSNELTEIDNLNNKSTNTLCNSNYRKAYLKNYFPNAKELKRTSLKKPNLLTIDVSNQNWSLTNEGQVLLRNYYQTIGLMSSPKLTIDILGDPAFQYGSMGMSPHISTFLSQFSSDKKYLSPISTSTAAFVAIRIFDVNGEINYVISGQYQVLGWEHKISMGNYTTTLNLIKFSAQMNKNSNNSKNNNP